MLYIRAIDNSRLVATQYEGAPDAAAAPKGAWYDLIDPTAEERAFVDRATGVSVPTREEIEEIEVSSRLYSEDGVEYMTVTAAARLDTDEPTKSPVMFIHNGGALVTVRYVELRPFTNVIERCGRPGGCASADPENLMLTLIEAMVDRLAERLKQNGNDVEGWLRLVRAYLVMGEREKAASARADARQAIGNDTERLRQLNEGLRNLGLDG